MIDAKTKLDLLFVAEHAFWPLDQGNRILGYQTALAAARQGARVGVACLDETLADAPEDLRKLIIPWPEVWNRDVTEFRRGWKGPGRRFRERIADHQGLEARALAGVVALVDRHEPIAVHGVGQHSVLMLRGLSHLHHVAKIWHAADELVYFNLSCMKREPVSAWRVRLRTLALHAALETFFCRGVDAALGVSPLDSKLLRLIGGAKKVVTVRNGVDLDYFAPRQTIPQPRSLAFWGRMDFEPNIDAALWFAHNVWPALRAKHADAQWHIIGKNPDARITALERASLNHAPGIRVWGEVADIRPAASAASVAILPMRCGGGIKNKLLEAAAMAMPIAASSHAVRGLDFGTGTAPLMICDKPDAWVKTISRLWADADAADALGRNARAWVEAYHSWDYAAKQLLGFVSELTGKTIGRNANAATNQVINESGRRAA